MNALQTTIDRINQQIHIFQRDDTQKGFIAFWENNRATGSITVSPMDVNQFGFCTFLRHTACKIDRRILFYL
jgi:hypothetical protein